MCIDSNQDDFVTVLGEPCVTRHMIAVQVPCLYVSGAGMKTPQLWSCKQQATQWEDDWTDGSWDLCNSNLLQTADGADLKTTVRVWNGFLGLL